MSDRLLEYEKHPKWKKFLYGATFVCLMLAGFLMVFSMRSKANKKPSIPDHTIGENPSAVGGESGIWSDTPLILVDGTIYYWTGMSLKYTGAETPGAQVSAPGISKMLCGTS